MSKLPNRAEIRQRLRKARGKDRAEVPGPTDNPAANLVFADILIRMGSYAVRNVVERSFLRGRYGKQTAKDIVGNRSLSQTLTAVAIAKLGTKSLPGMAVVSTGLLAKALYERSKSRHAAETEGDAELIERADTPSGRPDT